MSFSSFVIFAQSDSIESHFLFVIIHEVFLFVNQILKRIFCFIALLKTFSVSHKKNVSNFHIVTNIHSYP